MNEAIAEFALDEQDDVFARDVTDAALEAAACAQTQNARVFTVALCTVMADCSSS